MCESDHCVIRLFGAGLSDPFLTSSTNLSANDHYLSKKLVYYERSIERAPDTGVLTNKDIAYVQEFITERKSAGGIGPARASRGIIFPTLMVKVVWSCILTVISKEINFRPPKMPTEEITLKKMYAIISIVVLCLGFILVTGCTQNGTVPVTTTPAATPAPTSAPTTAPTVITTTPAVNVTTTSTPVITGEIYNESSNGTTVSTPTNGTFIVMLQENPTTGYIWNVTVTSGLTITNDTFLPPTSGLMGAGGVHEWSVEAIQMGQQQFNGIYKRPFENLTGNETPFVLNVNVT